MWQAFEDWGDSMLRIYTFDTLPSTQTYAIEQIKSNALTPPFCILAKHQSDAIGSRGNKWDQVAKALTFSFAMNIETLPQDLPVESSSIFFGFIFQQSLANLGSQVWLKWPNDLYIGENKVGGILTQKVQNILVCGIGINLYSNKHCPYGILEEEVSQKIQPQAFLEEYIKNIKKNTSWKQIFSIYKLEFYRNNTFTFHFQGQRVCLRETSLNDDGSLNFNGQRIYSLR